MMWTPVIILLSVSLIAYLLWATVRRLNRGRLLWRILASLTAVVSLACIAFDFKYDAPVAESSSGGLIVLTQGADDDSVSAFRKKHPGYPVYTLDAEIARREGDDIEFLSTTAALGSSGVQPIHVFGYGLQPYQLTGLNNQQIILHAPSTSAAFESVSWQTQLNSGSPLIVQGSYNNTGDKDVTIMLQGFSTHLDSVILKAGRKQNFQLSTVPRQLGRAVYTLSVSNNKNLLQEQKIPFTVASPEPLRILLLASAPDFENRFLKNWLFSRGYALAMRTTISLNKYHNELLNMNGSMPGRLNGTLLNNFDLVIGDATALAAMGASEKAVLRNAIVQHGLGLIVKVDSITAPAGFFTSGVRFRESSVNHRQQVKLFGIDSSIKLPVLEMDKPKHVNGSAAQRPLFADKEGNQYAVAGIAGTGRMIHTTLTNTYSWVLQGDTNSYRQVWSSLINAAAKRKPAAEVYTTSPSIVYTGEAVEIIAETSDTLPFRINVNQQMKPVMQQALMPFEWKAIFWPHKKGWQQFVTRDNITKYWYVYEHGGWQQIRARQTIEANRAIVSGRDNEVQETVGVAIQQSNNVLKIYFFIMFILSCAYLWIEEKFYNTGA